MKTIFYIFYVLFTLIFSSCGNSMQKAEFPGKRTVHIHTSLDIDSTSHAYKSEVDHFMIAVYSDPHFISAAEVFDCGTTHRSLSSNGEFTLILDASRTYHCLLWTVGRTYNCTNSMKEVTLDTNRGVAEAYYGTLVIDQRKDNYRITLKRTVDKLSRQTILPLPSGYYFQ